MNRAAPVTRCASAHHTDGPRADYTSVIPGSGTWLWISVILRRFLLPGPHRGHGLDRLGVVLGATGGKGCGGRLGLLCRGRTTALSATSIGLVGADGGGTGPGTEASAIVSAILPT